MSRFFTSIAGWLRGHVPTREGLERNRLLRPFAHWVLRAELWRFTRRSVPRAAALGVFVGVTMPFAHSLIAALLAVVFRVNVPVAIVATWISNPLTWPLMWPLAYWIGRTLLHFDAMAHLSPFAGALPDVASGMSPGGAGTGGAGHAGASPTPVAPASGGQHPVSELITSHHHFGEHAHRMFHHIVDAGLAVACGLAVEGAVLATLAYLIAALVWRGRLRRLRRLRRTRPPVATILPETMPPARIPAEDWP